MNLTDVSKHTAQLVETVSRHSTIASVLTIAKTSQCLRRSGRFWDSNIEKKWQAGSLTEKKNG